MKRNHVMMKVVGRILIIVAAGLILYLLPDRTPTKLPNVFCVGIDLTK